LLNTMFEIVVNEVSEQGGWVKQVRGRWVPVRIRCAGGLR